MKQRQEMKKMQQMQKRGMRVPPSDGRQPIQQQQYQSFKQSPQKKTEGQKINYYGQVEEGGLNQYLSDAPLINKIQPQQHSYEQNIAPKMYQQQDYLSYGEFNGYPHRQVPQYEQVPQQIQNNLLRYNQGNNVSSAQIYNVPIAPPSQQNIPLRIPTDRSYDLHQQQFQLQQQNRIQHTQQQPTSNNYPQRKPNQIQGTYNMPVGEIYQQPMQQINQRHDAYNQKMKENEEMMEIHKKGGRNLLQLQNMTIDQQQIKQKQKDEMRRQLQLQMKEAQQRKKQEQQRIKREEIEEQRRNQEYIKMQQKKIKDEERQKNEKQRFLIEQNEKNLIEKRRLDEEAKIKARNKDFPVQMPIHNSSKITNKQVYTYQTQIPNVETTSQVSDSHLVDKAFERNYYENQRRMDAERLNGEKNVESVTGEIRRLKDQIDQQNQIFLKEIKKIKLQSEMAENQKRKAEYEIDNLKNQLRRKMEDDNQRLFMALQNQHKNYHQTDQYQLPQKQPYQSRPPRRQVIDDEHNYAPKSNNVQILKPRQDEKMVKKVYSVRQQKNRNTQHENNLNESNVYEDDMLTSLHGDSKKIPINLPDKLSMSNLSEFARETDFFNQQNKGLYLGTKKSPMLPQESIIEVEQYEERGASRKGMSKRKNNKDELDRLVQSREKPTWGELSSVNSDITKQIQDLLKKKQTQIRPPSGSHYNNNNQRPSSHLSNAGRRAVSRKGIEYDGMSLGTYNSQVGQGSLGTYDIDRIDNKNERRLNELRNLGVETINTNGEDQFSKLDLILNKYKQSQVL